MLDRIYRLIVRPREEWRVIAAEPSSVDQLIRRYIIPLSLIAPLATMFGMKFFDVEWDQEQGYLVPPDQIFHAGATTLFATIASIFALAGIFRLLAPLYGSSRDYPSALKVATYGAVPVLVACATLIVPVMAMVAVVALFHTLFLYWIGVREILHVKASEQAEFVGISVMLLVALSTLAGAAASSLGIY